MKDFAESFYKSRQWQHCRNSFAKSKGGLCEKCLESGKITAGVIVHHKIHITPENINNPDITLNWDNLVLLCRDCHAQMHGKPQKRYVVDDLGNVIIK